MEKRAVAEAAAGPKEAALGALPQWDLSDLYPGPESPALARDLTRLAADADTFRQRYEGKLADLSGAASGGCGRDL